MPLVSADALYQRPRFAQEGIQSFRLQSGLIVPLMVFDTKGIPATRRERIEAAVEAGGKHISKSYEAWITTDPFRGGVRVLITGPLGFERSVQFAVDEDPFEITHRVRATLEDDF